MRWLSIDTVRQLCILKYTNPNWLRVWNDDSRPYRTRPKLTEWPGSNQLETSLLTQKQQLNSIRSQSSRWVRPPIATLGRCQSTQLRCCNTQGRRLTDGTPVNSRYPPHYLSPLTHLDSHAQTLLPQCKRRYIYCMVGVRPIHNEPTPSVRPTGRRLTNSCTSIS